MSELPPEKNVLLPRPQRFILGICGVLLLTLLVTARTLTPDINGLGTHTQLGLAECSMIRFFDRPCPSCGMTTSWAWTMRGDLYHAIQANLGGTILAIWALFTGPWLLGSSLKGTWWIVPPNEAYILTSCLLLVMITLLDWWQRCWWPF